MANDKDITIGLKTVGDTSGAEDVKKSIFDVEDAAKRAEREMDVLEVKRRQKTGEAQTDGGGIERQVGTIAMLQKAQVVMQLAGQLEQIGPKFTEMAESVKGFDKELASTLETTGQVVSKTGEAASAIALGFAAGGPAGAAVGAATFAVKELAVAWVDMKQSEHDAEEAAAAADAYPKYLAKRREFIAQHAGDISRLKSIREENTALHEQEDTFKRMLDLRNKLSAQAVTAAGQEVKLAKLKGGDVALAEANLIAATMKDDLDKLRGQLAGAQRSLAQAGNDELLAVGRLRDAQDRVAAGLTTAEAAGIKGLEETAKSAAEKQVTARENLNGLLVTFSGSQTNIIRQAEISLEEKEQEYQGKISPAAAKAFQKVFNSLGQELAKGPAQATAAIEQIKANAATVTTAATVKAQEVDATMQTAAAGSVQALAGIGASAGQSNRQISLATTQVQQALDRMTDKFITSIAMIAATGIKNAARLSTQQAQINQLFARIR